MIYALRAVACNTLLQIALFSDCKKENKHLKNCSYIHSSNTEYQAKFSSFTGFSKDTPRLNLARWTLWLFKFGVNVISCEDDGLSQTGQARAVQASPQKFCWYNTILTWPGLLVLQSAFLKEKLLPVWHYIQLFYDNCSVTMTTSFLGIIPNILHV